MTWLGFSAALAWVRRMSLLKAGRSSGQILTRDKTTRDRNLGQDVRGVIGLLGEYNNPRIPKKR